MIIVYIYILPICRWILDQRWWPHLAASGNSQAGKKIGASHQALLWIANVVHQHLDLFKGLQKITHFPYNFPHFWWISRWKKHAQEEHLGGPPWNPTLQGPFLWLGAIIRLFRYSTALGGPRFIIYIYIIISYI